MKKEIDQSLCNDFPKLFSNRNVSVRQSNFAFGFECGDGWAHIIRKCAVQIEAINDKIDNPEDWIRATQVKEKFGALRFYVSSVPEEHDNDVYSAIDEAEYQSQFTCEVCGKPGRTVGNNWFTTLCEEHEKEKNS